MNHLYFTSLLLIALRIRIHPPLIAGNWKACHNTRAEAVDLANDIDFRYEEKPDREVAIFPSHIHLDAVSGVLDTEIKIGAQDISPYDKGVDGDKGAHTGDSPTGKTLVDMDLDYVLVGHSERREAGDTDELIRRKVIAALRNVLFPILCVGEKLDAREAGKANEVVTEQLRKALDGVTADEMEAVDIAYEPVWAIGTGKNATPEDAESMCSHIREEIAQLFTQAVADKIRVLYGGSVTSKNAGTLMAQPNIDGLLVGGASLKVDEFEKIINFDSGSEAGVA